MWSAQSLVFPYESNIFLLKSEILQMIGLHESRKTNYVFPVSNNKSKEILMHHQSVPSEA